MINRIEAALAKVSIHQIGVKSEDEGTHLSSQSIAIPNDYLQDMLLRYMIDSFKEPEFFKFTFSNGDLALNPLYNFVSNVFDNEDYLHEQSVNIAKHLYESSNHPNIKGGDLMVAHIKDVLVDDELVDALAIIKSENKDAFLKLQLENGRYNIDAEDGINIEKLDKACLIFDTEREQGYKICIIDKSNRNRDALYWKEDFLNLDSREDNYHATTHYIQATRTFIKERLPFEEGADKRDEAEILHRSKTYLKGVETFDKDEYTKTVFSEEGRQSSFTEFCDDYMQEKGVVLKENFEVSESAVRKQTKYFRSVIKLDKNFHIYAHGDKSNMEKGSDENGRKYYKLYYESES